MRTRSVTNEIVERACAFVDRRGGSAIRRGGRARGSAQKKDPLLYGITGFSAANRLQTAIGGGEAGVDTGFGVVALAVWKEVPTGSQMLVQRVNGAVSAGWYLQTSGASLRAVFVSGAGVPVVSASYTIVASDLGRVIEIDASISGGMIWLIVNRQLVGAGVAITGYTPAASEDTVWSLWETTQAFTSGMLLSSATYRGNPSVAQRNAYADETRILGDLPTTIQGATITHRHSLRDQLRAIGGAVTSGQTAPATLDDTITRAAADALARQGSPTVVTIDTSRDGRRTLGVQGGTDTTYLEAVGGINGAAGSWFLQSHVLFRSGQASGTRVFLSCDDDPFTSGWNSFTTGANASLYFGFKNAGGADVNLGPIALSTSVLDRPVLLQLRYTGTVFELYLDGALVGSVTTTFRPVTSNIAMRIGRDRRAGLGTQGTAIDVYAIDGGNTLVSTDELAAAYAQTVRTGRLASIPGKSQHYYPLGEDVLAAGEAVPAQCLDRIGTDHLTRRGISIANGAVRVQTGQADFFRSLPGGGFRGAAAGTVVYWMGAIEDFTMAGAAIFAEVVSGSNAGWSLQSATDNYSAVRFCWFDSTGAFRTSASVALSSIVSAGQNVIVHGVWTGSYLQLYVQGTQRGADVGPYTGHATPASTEPMYIGSRAGTNLSPQNCRHLGFGAAAAAPSAAQIAAHAAACLAAGKIVAFAGFDDRRFDLAQDVIDAGGGLPSFTVDRAGSGEKLPRAGAPLQVAQRTERTWSYETSPIYYGASAFTDADRYVFDGGFPGDAASWWGLLWYIVTSQSVPSATRGLLACNTATSGWDVRTTLTNTTIAMGFADGAGSYATVGTSAIAAADVGKIQAFGFGWNAPAGQPQTFAKRAAIAAAARTGYTPSAGAPLVLGGFSALGNPAIAGISALGFALGFGAPALAEWQAAFDAGLALERVVGIANRTSTLVDLTLDAKANGGALAALAQDRAGGGRAMTRAGSPTITAHHARAFGW